MISSFQIAQLSHFRALIRFIGFPCQSAVEIEHHPQNDSPRTWTIDRPHANSSSALCEVEIWTVFGERKNICVRCTSTDPSSEPAITVIADEHGLTLLGVTGLH
jgi:hypothetical protein